MGSKPYSARDRSLMSVVQVSCSVVQIKENPQTLSDKGMQESRVVQRRATLLGASSLYSTSVSRISRRAKIQISLFFFTALNFTPLSPGQVGCCEMLSKKNQQKKSIMHDARLTELLTSRGCSRQKARTTLHDARFLKRL